MRAVVLLSGGLDSTTLAYLYAANGFDLHCLSFDYGQRHKKELHVAGSIAEALHAKHHVIKLGSAETPDLPTRPLGWILGSSSLTDLTVKVPDGHYAAESMKATVVPNRNAIMLSIAYGVAIAEGADVVGFAAHAGDHAIYPDCRPEFVHALNRALSIGNSWDPGTPVPVIEGLFLPDSKADIAYQAIRLNVPIERTWSCYKGGEVHCGTCGTCYERREAIAIAGAQMFGNSVYLDPTEYLDDTTVYEAPHA